MASAGAPAPDLAALCPPGWRLGIAYLRISDDPEHDELGVRRQDRLIREKAEAERIWLVATYVDDDRSAYVAKRRPDYERFLAHARHPEIDVVMAWHPDRMTRGDLVEIERLILALGGDEGTPIVTCETSDYDVSTPHGRMIARITGSVARYESEHKQRRVQAKMTELAHGTEEDPRGEMHRGRRAFGYTDRGEVVTAEAAIIRELADLVLAGHSIRSLAALLNERDVRTPGTKTNPEGNAWHPSAVKQMLTGPRIAGLRTHKGRIVAKGKWDAIIDEATHRRLVAVLAPKPRAERGPSPWVLSGFLRCERCGATLVCQTDGNGDRRRYICRKGPGYNGCGGLAIRAEALEALLGVLVTERMADYGARRQAAPGPDDDPELAELNEIAALKVEAGEDRDRGEKNGGLSRADYLDRMAQLNERKRGVEARLASKVRDTVPLDLVAAEGFVGRRWDELGVANQRRLLGALIESVTVAPASRRGSREFEPERVTADGRIAWKD